MSKKGTIAAPQAIALAAPAPAVLPFGNINYTPQLLTFWQKFIHTDVEKDQGSIGYNKKVVNGFLPYDKYYSDLTLSDEIKKNNEAIQTPSISYPELFNFIFKTPPAPIPATVLSELNKKSFEIISPGVMKKKAILPSAGVELAVNPELGQPNLAYVCKEFLVNETAGGTIDIPALRTFIGPGVKIAIIVDTSLKTNLLVDNYGDELIYIYTRALQNDAAKKMTLDKFPVGTTGRARFFWEDPNNNPRDIVYPAVGLNEVPPNSLGDFFCKYPIILSLADVYDNGTLNVTMTYLKAGNPVTITSDYNKASALKKLMLKSENIVATDDLLEAISLSKHHGDIGQVLEIHRSINLKNVNDQTRNSDNYLKVFVSYDVNAISKALLENYPYVFYYNKLEHSQRLYVFKNKQLVDPVALAKIQYENALTAMKEHAAKVLAKLQAYQTAIDAKRSLLAEADNDKTTFYRIATKTLSTVFYNKIIHQSALPAGQTHKDILIKKYTNYIKSVVQIGRLTLNLSKKMNTDLKSILDTIAANIVKLQHYTDGEDSTGQSLTVAADATIAIQSASLKNINADIKKIDNILQKSDYFLQLPIFSTVTHANPAGADVLLYSLAPVRIEDDIIITLKADKNIEKKEIDDIWKTIDLSPYLGGGNFSERQKAVRVASHLNMSFGLGLLQNGLMNIYNYNKGLYMLALNNLYYSFAYYSEVNYINTIDIFITAMNLLDIKEKFSYSQINTIRDSAKNHITNGHNINTIPIPGFIGGALGRFYSRNIQSRRHFRRGKQYQNPIGRRNAQTVKNGSIRLNKKTTAVIMQKLLETEQYIDLQLELFQSEIDSIDCVYAYFLDILFGKKHASNIFIQNMFPVDKNNNNSNRGLETEPENNLGGGGKPITNGAANTTAGLFELLNPTESNYYSINADITDVTYTESIEQEPVVNIASFDTDYFMYNHELSMIQDQLTVLKEIATSISRLRPTSRRSARIYELHRKAEQLRNFISEFNTILYSDIDNVDETRKLYQNFSSINIPENIAHIYKRISDARVELYRMRREDAAAVAAVAAAMPRITGKKRQTFEEKGEEEGEGVEPPGAGIGKPPNSKITKYGGAHTGKLRRSLQKMRRRFLRTQKQRN